MYFRNNVRGGKMSFYRVAADFPEGNKIQPFTVVFPTAEEAATTRVTYLFLKGYVQVLTRLEAFALCAQHRQLHIVDASGRYLDATDELDQLSPVQLRELADDYGLDGYDRPLPDIRLEIRRLRFERGEIAQVASC
jgi:hypothetical protein